MDNFLSSPRQIGNIVFCAKRMISGLRDLYKSTRKDSVRIDENGKIQMKGYETFATNLISLDELPFDIDISRLNDVYRC